VHGDTPDVSAAELDLARVEPGSDVDTELLGPAADGGSTLDAASWSVEGRQHAVAGVFDVPTPESLQLAADHDVVRVQELAPPPIPKPGRPRSGSGYVGEQHGGENPIAGRPMAGTGEELLDLVHARFAEVQMVGAVQLHELGPLDALGLEPPVLERHHAVVATMQHECWSADRRQNGNPRWFARASAISSPLPWCVPNPGGADSSV
jgi:hypothetical protein